MRKKSGQINIPSKGLNRDSWATNEADYVHLQNGNFDNFDGGTFTLTNEMSNILSSKFKEGFKVIGFKNDLNTDSTYFFLVNPETNVGEFGVIKSNQDNSDLDDLTQDCGDCIEIKELATPLEDLEQIELQEYITLLSDDCLEDKTLGFNFDINYPIKTPVIKDEKCGKTIYFTDNLNPPRYINIDKIEDYFIQEVTCDDDIQVECPIFTKMEIFKRFSIPKLTPVSIELGGSLKMGVYQFLIAYCDALGNEISEYYSITNPISIFDRNNIQLTQPQLADKTNFAIKLKVEGLDNRYTHYKIAVIQTADIDFTDSYFIEGVHTIDEEDILYTSEANKVRTSIDNLVRLSLKVNTTEGMTSSNNMLFQYGIDFKKEVNLQPIVNLMGEAIEWQTYIAPENLYEDGVATSLYKGFNRDEVVPFGIKFLFDGGYETSVFPFIARQAESSDLTPVAELNEEGDYVAIDGNKDVESILANKSNCQTTDRTKKWQYYNTAEENLLSESCILEDIETVEVVEQVTKFCVIDDVATIPTGTLSISTTEQFTSLEQYINNNRGSSEAECGEAFLTSTEDICAYLYDEYSEDVCNTEELFPDNCGDFTFQESIVEVSNVLGESVTKIEKVFSLEYSKIVPPPSCRPYVIEPTSGTPVRDTEFENFIQESAIYQRDSDFFNESCAYAVEIVNNTNPSTNTAQPVFNNGYYEAVLEDLYATPSKTGGEVVSGFYTNIHKNGLWFKGETQSRTKLILEVSKQKDATDSEFFDLGVQSARVSIFKSCSATSAIFSKVIDLDQGGMFILEKDGLDLKITEEDGVTITTITNGWFSSGEYLVVVDNPIISKSVEVAPESFETVYYIKPTRGCYTVTSRDIEFSRIDVTWDEIILQKSTEITATCTFEEPIVKGCKAIPYRRGKFAYWESSRTYPDNNELFNSSVLEVSPEDIPEEFRTIFEDKFVDNIVEGKYVWKKDSEEKELVDFTCRNIRHFKFPDNKVAPFVYSNSKAGFTSTTIFPLGVTLNEQVVSSFLDVAVKNGLITQKDRELITGYEIVRGDLTLNRSVLASGLLYDMRRYQEKEGQSKYLLYSNYPFNSYSEDKMNSPFSTEDRINLGRGAVWGDSNRNFTFHSPETDYRRFNTPSEMTVQAYMFGNAKVFFDEVKDHPKWVILTNKARDLAGILAGLEVATEIAVLAANYADSYNFGTFVGLSSGIEVNPVGIGLAIAASALTASSYIVVNYGRYRYEWLKIFQDLGTPYNFAYYSFAEGNYNYLQTLQEQGNSLRGVNIGKYLNEGRFSTNNEVTGEKLELNNIDRERSMFLSSGDFPIVYPNTYKNFDRNNSSSLTFLGENGLKDVGRSSEILKNIASPYVALKDYLPEQHGTVNSINWIPTGFRGDFMSSCVSIFGGDTFISRHTLKRKHSQFLVTSMKQADLTPFNYFFYNNIGKNPLFWVSYLIDKEFNRNGRLFPDITTDKSFDNNEEKGNYFRPPSKFYLYYYGVPSFLCETRINTNNRYAGLELSKQFYPQVGDLGEWTQETNVPIRTPNDFRYNDTYSKQTLAFKTRKLSVDYSLVENLCKNNFPNGVIYSLPDNSENSSIDPWLINRPLDFYEFPTSWGKLKELRGIESAQVLSRLTNTVAIFNAVDTIVDDGQRPQSQFLGDGGVFARRPVTFSETDLGYGGTQTSMSVSCEYGHFHVDAKRGQVIQIENGGKGIKEISAFAGEGVSGMRNWFKEHLPFKILKSKITGIEDVDTDNAYNGIGIVMGYDSRFRRIFITKKDYVVKRNDIIYVKGEGFKVGETVVKLTDPIYFEDASWTIAYSPIQQAWMSFYDFKPNYYINHNDYFQTGINQSNDDSEFGLWAHLLTNRSYQVYYGKRYPFIIEYQLKRKNSNILMNSISYQLDVLRYSNEYDFAEVENKAFDKLWIYSMNTHSGELGLVPNTGQMSLISKYPKTAPDGKSQDILYSKYHNQHTINYFYNRVSRRFTNTPITIWDINQINKTVNTDVVKFYGKNMLEPLRTTVPTIRLEQTKESRLRYVFHLGESKFEEES
jgi:hypothetical protein